jgi:type VI secretion system ImpM family protein
VTGVSLGAPGLLGKHPSRGDFVNIGNRSQEFTSFDAFLTHNLEWAEARAGSRWVDAYSAGGVHAFVYRSAPGKKTPALVGAFGPSSDRAGRRFPLTVAMPLAAPAELLAAPEIMPLVLEPCWNVCSQLVLSLAAEPNANVAERLSQMSVPEVDLDDALGSYAEWTRSLPVDELWGMIFGEDQRVNPAQLVALVSETVRSCRGVDEVATPLSLRLPLGLAGGAAVCFWLDWAGCIAGWKANVPTFFWSHNGTQGTMTLALGRLPHSTLAELWLPTGSRDEICDIATAPHDLQLPEEGAARWLSAQQRSGRTVAELLHSAHTWDF